MPVLITAGLSPEAYRLKRILQEAGGEKREVRNENREANIVVFADERPLPQIPGIQSLVLPRYTSASFVHELLKACLDLGITKVYPLKAGEVTELSKARSLFLEYNVTLIIPSADWLKNTDLLIKGSAENITVLEDGKTTGGTALPDNNNINKETGVFCRATNGPKMEYSLYLVEDAGI